ncbi:MAG: choice-of-anchor D domain-containing protein [Alphaproteobacteria bacterium]|nr:choice-of-anchor D domain-containing protein [Alphaproteobacteria bacterium]
MRALLALPPLFLLSSLQGCNDTGLTAGKQTNDAIPDIVVTPATLDFGPVPEGGVADGQVVIENVGNAALDVTGMSVDGAAFTLVSGPTVLVGPGDVATVSLSYTPVNADDSGFLTIKSNDPDTPSLPVALVGRGAFPVLEIDPSPVDLGQTELCDDEGRTVAFKNVGEADLTITQTLLSGSALSLDEPAWPQTVAPGDQVDVTVHFAPGRVGGVAGELWVDSNDPAGARKATVSAQGVVDGRVSVTDEFRQPDGPWDRTDVMFFVDRSCSMKDDEANLQRNIGILADELSAADSDWQFMVTIDDYGCSEGDFITPETADVPAAFGAALATAPGSYTEAGLTITTRGLERSIGGGCNQGFLREDSKTLIVTVSDEPEQSPEDWSHYTARMRGVAPSAAVVAVVGDLPDGCATAEPGSGYVEAAEATGGVFLSICDADWGEYFSVVGELATSGPQLVFPLSATPDPSTIGVSIDGETSSAWDYEATDNSIVFRSQPSALSLIQVDYDLTRDCGGSGAGDSGAGDSGAGD